MFAPLRACRRLCGARLFLGDSATDKVLRKCSGQYAAGVYTAALEETATPSYQTVSDQKPVMSMTSSECALDYLGSIVLISISLPCPFIHEVCAIRSKLKVQLHRCALLQITGQTKLYHPFAELRTTLSQLSSQERAHICVLIHMMAQCIVTKNKLKISLQELETSFITRRTTEMALETERVKGRTQANILKTAKLRQRRATKKGGGGPQLLAIIVFWRLTAVVSVVVIPWLFGLY